MEANIHHPIVPCNKQRKARQRICAIGFPKHLSSGVPALQFSSSPGEHVVDNSARTKQHCHSHQHIRRYAWINQFVEVMEKKRTVVGGKTGPIHQPLLKHRQRTGRPRDDLNENAIGKRSYVDPFQPRVGAHQQHPAYHPQDEKQVNHQHRFRQQEIDVQLAIPRVPDSEPGGDIQDVLSSLLSPDYTDFTPDAPPPARPEWRAGLGFFLAHVFRYPKTFGCNGRRFSNRNPSISLLSSLFAMCYSFAAMAPYYSDDGNPILSEPGRETNLLMFSDQPVKSRFRGQAASTSQRNDRLRA